MREAQEPAEVRVAAEVARDHDDLLAVHLQRRADDRLHPELAAGLEKLHRAIDPAAVGDRERRHLQLCRPGGQLERMRPAIQEREVGVTVQLDVGVHDRTCRPMLLAWPELISDATFAVSAVTRFESSSRARASSSVTSASSCATRSSTTRMTGRPRQDGSYMRASAKGCVSPGSETSSRCAATRRSLATKIGDCHLFVERDTVVDGPEGNVRRIWHQPQGRRRSPRGDPAGSFLFLRRPIRP
jgi:hypothetical protein